MATNKKKAPDPKLPLHKYIALGGKPADWKKANPAKKTK